MTSKKKVDEAHDKTVQTVQNFAVEEGPREVSDITGNPYFRVEEDASGLWYWMLFARNGRPVATNVIGFKRRNDCTEALKTLKEMFSTKEVLIKKP